MDSQNEQPDAGLTIADLLRILRRHVVLAISVCVLIVAVVAAYTFTRTPMYTATTSVVAQLSTEEESSEEDDMSQSAKLGLLNSAVTYIYTQIGMYPNLVKTQEILQPVIDELDLDMTPGQLAGEISSSQEEDQLLVTISVTDADARRCADIANAVSKSLTDYVSGTKSDDQSWHPIDLSQVQVATVPSRPSAPKYELNLAVGLLAGIVLGVIAALVRDLLDTRIRRVSDVQSIIDIPVLGYVPDNTYSSEQTPVVASHVQSAVGESYRRLRTNMTFVRPDVAQNSNVFVVSSTGADEGKTTTAINLAAAFAENHNKVLLIDADIRKPSVADRLGISGTVGLTHLITGQAKSTDVIQRYWMDNFHVLPVGKHAPNPSALVNSHSMASLIEQTSRLYDTVIIDTAPLGVADDAAVFAKQGANLLLVVRCGRTLKRALREVARSLHTLGVNAVGFVSTFDSQEDRVKDSYYYHYYGSKHKDDSKTKRRGIHRKTAKAAKAA